MVQTLKEFLLTPITTKQKQLIILFVALIYIIAHQWYPNDWDLNTSNFWSDIPNTYKNNPNFVYPPWGLILLVPYRLMLPGGARFFSVIVIGWLAVQQKWSLSRFLAITLSPYFLVTMVKSSLDILVLVFPIILWRLADRKSWQAVGWGLALSILLLKPQGSAFFLLYLLWISRKRLHELLIPLSMVMLVTIPVSLIGSPPLMAQWLDNILRPSSQNLLFWSLNNISLTHRFNISIALFIIAIVALGLLLLVRLRRVTWTGNHTFASLLFLSFFLSPYASQQSVSSALAFVPSWGSVFLQSAGLWLAFSTGQFYGNLPLWILLFAVISLVLFMTRGTQAGDISDNELA